MSFDSGRSGELPGGSGEAEPLRPGFDVARMLELGELAPLSADPRCDADYFQTRIGDLFRFEQAGRAAELELVEVHRHQAHPEQQAGSQQDHGPLRPQPFSLLFRGPRERPLGNGLHVVTHAELGRGALFITPVMVSLRRQAATADLHYEALFN